MKIRILNLARSLKKFYLILFDRRSVACHCLCDLAQCAQPWGLSFVTKQNW